ncbi:MAG: NADPH-dependent oxidoreductase [Alphaproteobacteria bacterium]|nr:NADPH-dependent oxidoreductase [Alphaproteobacteria bacterium]
MHISIIAGSHRPNSQSARVGKYLQAQLQQLSPDTTTDLIDLAGNPLPLWDESAWQADGAVARAFAPYAQKLRASDGLVVISPEWAGMAPPALKNFLLLATEAEVGHKPATIVTVSSSRGGSYPVDELRHSGYKNNKILWLPEHLIVRDVADKFGAVSSGKDDDYLRARATFALKQLLAYASALVAVRQSGVTADKAFPFGM